MKGAGGGAEGGGQQPAAARGQRGKSHGQVSRKFDIFIKNSAKHTHQSIVDEGRGGSGELMEVERESGAKVEDSYFKGHVCASESNNMTSLRITVNEEKG